MNIAVEDVSDLLGINQCQPSAQWYLKSEILHKNLGIKPQRGHKTENFWNSKNNVKKYNSYCSLQACFFLMEP